ncbi:SMI1/KNR4 family protein [Undibacterium sp. Di24W]|uniref:SMI1/KNR4 family protein n=1 Tax=Undibacterium sp. Di24W TaxID=3413033 RepID=UPI003BEF7A68
METTEKIAEVEEWLGLRLPEQYAKFLLEHPEKILGERVLLYSVDDLIERNSIYETKAYCPGHLVIGDDSGGRAFIIPIDKWTGSVFIVDHGDMTEDGCTLVTTNFDDWINNDCALPD